MLAAVPALGFCLALVAFMPTIWTTGLVIAGFYAAYYVYEPPYRGLYPDLLHESMYGRSQSVQHVLRGVAIGCALVGGGFLLKLWRPAPFLLAAVVTTAACGAVVFLVREDGGHDRVFRGVRAYIATSWQIFRREPDVRMFLLANAAWEGTFAAMRTWVVLYITQGLGQPLSTRRPSCSPSLRGTSSPRPRLARSATGSAWHGRSCTPPACTESGFSSPGSRSPGTPGTTPSSSPSRSPAAR